MARFEHLPIYKKAYELALYFETTVHHFNRLHKYSLGAELRQYSREVAKTIRRANNGVDKLPHLYELRDILEELKFTLNLCKDVKAFNSFNSFQVAINLVINISKQNEGWIKSLSKK